MLIMPSFLWPAVAPFAFMLKRFDWGIKKFCDCFSHVFDLLLTQQLFSFVAIEQTRRLEMFVKKHVNLTSIISEHRAG